LGARTQITPAAKKKGAVSGSLELRATAVRR
jgi:hypothetical protein